MPVFWRGSSSGVHPGGCGLAVIWLVCRFTCVTVEWVEITTISHFYSKMTVWKWNVKQRYIFLLLLFIYRKTQVKNIGLLSQNPDLITWTYMLFDQFLVIFSEDWVHKLKFWDNNSNFGLIDKRFLILVFLVAEIRFHNKSLACYLWKYALYTLEI